MDEFIGLPVAKKRIVWEEDERWIKISFKNLFAHLLEKYTLPKVREIVDSIHAITPEEFLDNRRLMYKIELISIYKQAAKSQTSNIVKAHRLMEQAYIAAVKEINSTFDLEG